MSVILERKEEEESSVVSERGPNKKKTRRKENGPGEEDYGIVLLCFVLGLIFFLFKLSGLSLPFNLK